MGIRRKGSRPITVDETKYRWLTNGNDYGIDLYVELYDQPAQRLRTVFNHFSVLAELQHYGGNITPHVVEFTIRYALKHGWKPEQKGKEFLVREAQINESGKANSD